MATREIEEITTVKRKRIVYICDICGGVSDVELESCFICGKNVCDICRRYIPINPKIWHEHESCCCNRCWDAGKDHIAAMDAAESIFRSMFENEIFMWKQEMKAN